MRTKVLHDEMKLHRVHFKKGTTYYLNKNDKSCVLPDRSFKNSLEKSMHVKLGLAMLIEF